MVLVLLLGGLFAFTGVQGWKVSKGYSISFSGKGVEGIFKRFKADINFDERNLAESRFMIIIDVNSLNTGSALQNKHATGIEWFDAARYPQVTFVSSSIEKNADGYQAKGKMTIKGNSKDISIPFNFTNSGAKAKFTSNFSIKRSDFFVGKPSNDVWDEIKIKVELPVEK